MRWMIGLLAAAAMAAATQAAAEEKLSVLEEKAPPEVAAKPLALGAKPRSLSLARVGDTMKHGQLWAVILWGKDCKFDSSQTWDTSKDAYGKTAALERLFREELSKLGFVVAGDPNNLFKGDEDDGADLQVGALITDISVLACGGRTRAERKLDLDQTQALASAQMSVEWQIYSPVESRVLAKIPTVARIDLDPQTNAGDAAMLEVFAKNVRVLGSNEAFQTAVLATGPSVSERRRPVGAAPILLTLAPSMERPLAESSGSVVALFTGDGMGSGFLVSRDGYVLTNRHVVGGSKYLKVKWSDGVETVGEVVRSDIGRDIALVKTEARGRQPIVLHPAARYPDAVFAIGTPLDPRLQGSVTRGVVSANRILEGYSYIQSDVVVNPGNSGGPLLNVKGEAIEVTVFGIGQDKAPRGINFFIPIEDALDFLSLKVAPAAR